MAHQRLNPAVNMRRPTALVPRGVAAVVLLDRAYPVGQPSPRSAGHAARGSHTIPSAFSSVILAAESLPTL